MSEQRPPPLEQGPTSAGPAEQQALMRELAHRGRNILSMVLAIAALTLTGRKPLAEEREALFGRLHALAQSFGALDEDGAERIAMSELAAGALAAFADRATATGPELIVAPKAAQTLALALHELAANAVQHGALSSPGGSVTLSWSGAEQEEGGRRFRLQWLEEGGPPAAAPARAGFGLTMIGSVAGNELSARTETEFTASGFRYRLDAPLGEITGRKAAPLP